MKTICSAPAKLILSGEHAVLYQCPALRMAIDLPTLCWTERWAEHPSHIIPSLHIELCNFLETLTLSFNEYRQQALQIEQRYQSFLQGNASIKTVLTQPIELILCTLYHFEQRLTKINPNFWSFKIQSKSPIGRGLGSSAAVILSLLASLLKHHSMTLSPPELLTLAQRIEARQHGQSSGIDPATLIYAGLVRYQTNQPIEPIISPPLKAWLIDTGRPDSSTGEWVVSVKAHYQHDRSLWHRFQAITEQITSDIQHNEWQNLQQSITQNHQLLTKIGVVPVHIQTFISTLQNQYHAAAKICGAGSLSGKSAGVILCLSKDAPTQLCQDYGYTCQPIALQPQGVTCDVI